MTSPKHKHTAGDDRKTAEQKWPEQRAAQPPATGLSPACPWPNDRGEEIVAALRAYFLTHTWDPLTGEVHTLH